jgi:hypothetical protein
MPIGGPSVRTRFGGLPSGGNGDKTPWPGGGKPLPSKVAMNNSRLGPNRLACYSGLAITPQAMRGGAPLEAPAETA